MIYIMLAVETLFAYSVKVMMCRELEVESEVQNIHIYLLISRIHRCEKIHYLPILKGSMIERTYGITAYY